MCASKPYSGSPMHDWYLRKQILVLYLPTVGSHKYVTSSRQNRKQTAHPNNLRLLLTTTLLARGVLQYKWLETLAAHRNQFQDITIICIYLLNKTWPITDLLKHLTVYSNGITGTTGVRYIQNAAGLRLIHWEHIAVYGWIISKSRHELYTAVLYWTI